MGFEIVAPYEVGLGEYPDAFIVQPDPRKDGEWRMDCCGELVPVERMTGSTGVVDCLTCFAVRVAVTGYFPSIVLWEKGQPCFEGVAEPEGRSSDWRWDTAASPTTRFSPCR